MVIEGRSLDTKDDMAVGRLRFGVVLHLQIFETAMLAEH